MSDKPIPPQFPADRETKEPGLPLTIPMSILRWLAYSALFTVIIMPALWDKDVWSTIAPALILGHFASQLNALINKK
jgi:hypothetical protein